jgi:hypothetical protein
MHTVPEPLQHALPTRQRVLALASCTQVGTFAALSAEPVNVIVLGCSVTRRRAFRIKRREDNAWPFRRRNVEQASHSLTWTVGGSNLVLVGNQDLPNGTS